jgi:hypothetical protein
VPLPVVLGNELASWKRVEQVDIAVERVAVSMLKVLGYVHPPVQVNDYPSPWHRNPSATTTLSFATALLPPYL